METPLLPLLLVQYSRCKSNCPKSLRVVYSQDCVSTQPRNCCGVVIGPPGASSLRKSPVRCPTMVPSAMTVHWPSPMTSQPSRFLPLNMGLPSAASADAASNASRNANFMASVYLSQKLSDYSLFNLRHLTAAISDSGRRSLIVEPVE